MRRRVIAVTGLPGVPAPYAHYCSTSSPSDRHRFRRPFLTPARDRHGARLLTVTLAPEVNRFPRISRSRVRGNFFPPSRRRHAVHQVHEKLVPERSRGHLPASVHLALRPKRR